MENAIINQTPAMPLREIGVVTAEIKELRRQANRMATMYAIEIGRRLVEAKSVLQHGEWGAWLEHEAEFSQSTANNLMRLYEEYGSEQISIFGAISNSQTIANLPYTKALQLLAIPFDEREEFAEKVDAENISVKELQAAIKERDEALKSAAEAKRRQEELEQAVADAEISRNAAEQKAAEADKYRSDVDNLTAELSKQKEKEKKLKEKLKAAQEDKTVPPETLAELKAEAEKAAMEKADAELESKLAELKEKAEMAETEKADALAKAEAAEKRIVDMQKSEKMSNPDIATFKALFEEVQQQALKLKRIIVKVSETDTETGEKLGRALKAFGESL